MIIVTYNGLHWIDKCIGSIQKSSLQPKIIIVDNASTDDTCKKIQEQYSEVHLIQLKDNIGFGRANNIGIKKAYEFGATNFFLLNQDAWVESDTIEKLATMQNKNPEFAILSPMHLNGQGTALDYNFSIYIVPFACPNLYSDFCLDMVADKAYEVDFVNAAAWLLTRECIEKIGGFNPSFFHYAEDDNFIQRVHYYKFKVGIYPLCKIFHDRESRPSYSSEDEFEKFKRACIKKYSNPFSKNNITKDMSLLKISILQLLLKGRINTAKALLKQHKILSEIKGLVSKNLNKSIKGEQLCFLND
ncbi:MAG TPA: glycosyltransferase family 2 protein [Panacibacter sp.]|nr:glycosyltransferase family 2 protein [Panacibacter sp.]